MTTPAASRPTFQVYPLRFSADPAAMIDFLRTIGLVPAVTSEGETFGELVAGGGGHVMVHGVADAATRAEAGQTHLCFAVDSTDDAAESLRSSGAEVQVWDETYGRQGSVRGPHGEGISLNEIQRDLYGYRGHDASGADPRIAVTAVRASAAGAEREEDQRFFSAFGFDPAGPGDRWWQALTVAGGGVIGLHDPSGTVPATAPGDEVFGDVALVRLGLETEEDLADLAERLGVAGHPARVVEGDGVTAVHVEDPDGCPLEIHSRTPSER